MTRTHGFDEQNTGAQRETILHTVLLLVGGLALVGGLLAAHTTPATGYEVNIYTATPLLYWVGLGVALFAAVLVLTAGADRVQWAGAAAIAGVAGMSIPALPLVRGYYYYGLSDPLGHLGIARELLNGTMTFLTDYYLAGHVLANFISVSSDARLEQAMMLVVLVMLLIFVVFSTLAIRTILPNRVGTAIALLSALLFLPINHISIRPLFHTYSLTTFFIPFVLFIFLKHVTADGRDPTIAWRLSATDLAFFVAGLATVFYHPQVAANLIVFWGSISVTQYVARRRYPDTLFGSSTPVYGQFVALTLVFFAWNLQFEALFDVSGSAFQSLVQMFLGTTEAGQIVQDRAASAEGAGTSIYKLFMNIFLVQAGYVAVAAAVVGAKMFGFLKVDRPESDITVQLFSISGISLAFFFLTYVAGDVSVYLFRHIGFGMVVATVVAVIGLTSVSTSLLALRSRTRESLKTIVRVAAVVLIGLVLIHSIAVVFSSPFTTMPTSHVSEQHYVGHDEAFEIVADDAALAAPRSPPNREHEARGTDIDGRLLWTVPSESMRNGLRELQENDWPEKDYYYLFVSETARDREIIAYNGFRYDEATFEAVPRQEGVSRVYSNGEVEMYQVLYSAPETDGPNERMTVPVDVRRSTSSPETIAT